MKNYEFLINTKTLKILVFEVKIKDFEVIPSDESNIKVNKTILDSPKNNIRKIVIKKMEQIIDIFVIIMDIYFLLLWIISRYGKYLDKFFLTESTKFFYKKICSNDSRERYNYRFIIFKNLGIFKKG